MTAIKVTWLIAVMAAIAAVSFKLLDVLSYSAILFEFLLGLGVSSVVSIIILFAVYSYKPKENPKEKL